MSESSEWSSEMESIKFEESELFKKLIDENFLKEKIFVESLMEEIKLKIYNYQAKYGIAPNTIEMRPIEYDILKKEMKLYLSSEDWKVYKKMANTFLGLELNIVKDLPVMFRVGYME